MLIPGPAALQGPGTANAIPQGGPLNENLDGGGFNIYDVAALIVQGLVGANTQDFRLVGSNPTGPPATGTFAAGDVAFSLDPGIWICTSAGSPGQWTNILDLGFPDHLAPVVGEYLDNGAMFNGGNTRLVEAREFACPVWVPSTMTFDQIGMMVGGVGSTGSVVRFGVRSFQTATPRTPGTPFVDFGTTPTTSGGASFHGVTGTPFTLTRGPWWVCCAQQGGAVTTTQPYSLGFPYIRIPQTGFAGGRWVWAAYQDSVPGALPTNWIGTNLSLDSSSVFMALHRSA